MFLVAEIQNGEVINILPTQLRFPELGDCRPDYEFLVNTSCLNVASLSGFDDFNYSKIDTAPFIENNEVYTYRLVEKSEEDKQKEYGQAITKLSFELLDLTQTLLDDFARTRRYDSILSAISYSDSSVPKYKADALRCKELRDLTWETAIGIITANDFSMMSKADFINLLPKLEWTF